MRLHGGTGLTCCVLVAVAASLAASQAGTAATPPATLRLVSTAWPPFTNEPGQLRFALDLVEEALRRTGKRAITAIVDAARFTPAILSTEFDGSAAAWKDPERERALIYSEPYLENRLILIGRRGEDVSAATMSTLKGKRVAIVGGYSYGDTIEASGAVLVRSQSEEDSLSLLLAGKTTYVLMDELVVEAIVNSYPKEAGTKLSLGATPLVTRRLYFAVRRSRPDAEAIIRDFNAELRGMIADRTYHRLLHVPWIEADVDGDGLTELVPNSDRTGAVEPQHAYELFTLDQPVTKAPDAKKTNSRFYVGGDIYTDWSKIPDHYKIQDLNDPDPRRVTPIFTFSWK